MSSDEGSINNDNLVIEDNEILEVGEDLQENDENTEEVQRDETADGEENREDGEKTTVKPKRVVRNPQPKLNSETLKGPRGIAALPSYFERVKFKGKGYECQDLNIIMKTYEYWCHRLFPKFPFDTCIEKLEKLGSKRPVQTHIKRIRFDLLVEDKPIIDSSDEETNVEGFVEIQNDQLQNQHFDNLLATSAAPIGQQQPELTEEQLERIRLNKERAEKLRQERLRKIRDKAEVNLGSSSSQLPGTSGLENIVSEHDVESTQSDTFSQEIQETFEEPAFDHESGIKGKNTLRGSSAKKKSGKKITNGKDLNGVHSVSEHNFSHMSLNEKNTLVQSENEETCNEVSEDHTLSRHSQLNGDDNTTSITNNRRNNFIESDESDQEHSQLNGDDDFKTTLSKTNNRRNNFIESDESDQEHSQLNGDDDINTSKTNNRRNNFIVSDESDHEMADTSKKHNYTDTMNSDENSNDKHNKAKRTKRKVVNILDSDNSDAENDNSGVKPLSSSQEKAAIHIDANENGLGLLQKSPDILEFNRQKDDIATLGE